MGGSCAKGSKQQHASSESDDDGDGGSSSASSSSAASEDDGEDRGKAAAGLLTRVLGCMTSWHGHGDVLHFARSETVKVRSRATVQRGSRALMVDNTGKCLEDYYDADRNHVIGEGGYAAVLMGTDRRTGVKRAVKCITKKMVASRERLQREIDIVSRLDHPNINRLYMTFEDKRYIYLVLELCSGGELFDRIQELGHLSEREAAIIMQQIFRAVFYMHNNGVCHRDLKPENFLFQHRAPIEGNTLKVIDFGIAALFNRKGQTFSTKTGTPYYVAPEVLSIAFAQYTSQVDMWSCGVIMYVLLSGRLPFRGHDDHATFSKVKAGKFSFPEDLFGSVSSAAKALIRGLLTKDAAQRLSAEDALNDSWVRDHAPTAPSAPLQHNVVRALRLFQAENKLKKAALHVVARQLDEQQIRQLRNIFMELDANGDGNLTPAELSTGLMRAELGHHLPEDLGALLASVDADGSGTIDYSEFLAATLERRQYNSEQVCWAAFRVFDRNDDGKISPKELMEVLQSKDVIEACGKGQVSSCKDNVAELMQEIDRNGDGFIDFDEFMRMMVGSTSSASLDERRSSAGTAAS